MWPCPRTRRSSEHASSSGLAARQEGEAFQKMDILLVLEERTVQRRDEFLRIAFAQGLRRNVFVEQKLQPVQQFGGRWLLLQPGHVADLVEDIERFRDQPLLDLREMHVDDS